MNTPLRQTAACSLTLMLWGFVAACSTEDKPQPAPTTQAASSSVTTTAPPTTSESTTQVKTTSAKTTTRKSNDGVEKTRQMFGTLAPDSLFDQFDSCNPNGVEDSMACSGQEVGQFQFFASDSKAASTTQLLTGLRNSKVIKDTGQIVVGWSTLGNTAIITVVDNDNGLVLQQMVSTEEVDPTERIYELGLAEETNTKPTESTAPTSANPAN